MEGRAERLLASAAAFLVPVAYLSIFSINQSPLAFIPAILAAVYPPVGVAAAALVPLFMLYITAPFAAYAIAAPMFLVLSRVFSSWRDAAAILLSVPVILLYPPLTPLVLGVVIAQLSSGDEVGTVISGLVFVVLLYVASAIVLPQPALLGGIIFLPGGYASKLAAFTAFGKAGELLMYLLLDLRRMPVLLAEAVAIPLAALAGNMAWRRYGAGYAALASAAVLGVVKFIVPGGLDAGLWDVIFLLASLGAVNLTAYFVGSRGGKTLTGRVGSSLRSPLSDAVRGGRTRGGSPAPRRVGYVKHRVPEVGEDILELLFYDMSSVAEAAERIIGRGARVIVYGPRLEDEELFVKYARLTHPNVLLAHSIGDAWYEQYKGYVVYVPPLDPDEAVDVVEGACRLRGFTPAPEILARAREKLSGVSRYGLALLCERMIASQCRDAAPLEYVQPDIGPRFFIEFEKVQERLPIIGLKA